MGTEAYRDTILGRVRQTAGALAEEAVHGPRILTLAKIAVVLEEETRSSDPVRREDAQPELDDVLRAIAARCVRWLEAREARADALADKRHQQRIRRGGP